MQSRNESWAKVVLDSVSPAGKRIVTVEARYWRAIHAEIMTHRDRARNAASSRAIPFIRFSKDDRMPVANCTYSYIQNDYFLPEFIGAEQKGMQSGGELPEPQRSEALEIIDELRQMALASCLALHDLGVHKSIINRYLEPWSYITVVMTATEWKNFFRLRVHPKAEKHFNKIASQIKDAIDASVPTQLNDYAWHMPYLRGEDYDEIRDGFDSLNMENVPQGDPQETRMELMKRVSAARCARLSYLTHEGKRSLNADLDLFRTLIHPKLADERDDDVIHASPLEHVAQASCHKNFRSGPFVGWKQFRSEFANENVSG